MLTGQDNESVCEKTKDAAKAVMGHAHGSCSCSIEDLHSTAPTRSQVVSHRSVTRSFRWDEQQYSRARNQGEPARRYLNSPPWPASCRKGMLSK